MIANSSNGNYSVDERKLLLLTSPSRYIYLYLSEMKKRRGLSFENVWKDPQRLFKLNLNCLNIVMKT